MHPRTVTELRSFLGMCIVFRRVVQGYLTLASPLYRLTKKAQGIKLEPFGEAEQKISGELIDRATSPPVWALPKNGLFYSFDTDGSPQQVGAALFQEDEAFGNKRQQIGYWSSSFD